MPITLGKYPAPFPYITNETSCSPQEQQTNPEDLPSPVPPCAALRLFSLQTKSSAAKKDDDNPWTPKDSLDMALSACYDHHHEWWVPSTATKIQSPTFSLLPLGRCQRRLCEVDCIPESKLEVVEPDQIKFGACVNHEAYRNHSSHVDSHIAGPHTSNTARGYGRGIDGLFYNS